jgi:hypothetical protein
MKTFRNANFTARDYACTNIVACIGETAPTDGVAWVEVECELEAEILVDGLTKLYRQNGRTFFGHL